MKKRIISLVAVMMFATVSMLVAQDWKNYAPAYDEGDLAVQAGVGFMSGFSIGNTTVPPISISAEKAIRIADFPFSVGGFVGYSASKFDAYYTDITYSYLLVGARMAIHPDFDMENCDTYAGIMLGYNVVTSAVDDNEYDYLATGASSLIYGGFIGTRYFFTDNIAAFAEVGYGMGLFTLGATYKL